MRLKLMALLTWSAFKIELINSQGTCSESVEKKNSLSANCYSGTRAYYDSCCPGTCNYGAYSIPRGNKCQNWGASSQDCSSSAYEMDVFASYNPSIDHMALQASGGTWTLTTRWDHKFFIGPGQSNANYASTISHWCPVKSCSVSRVRDRTGASCDQTTQLFGVKNGPTSSYVGDYDWYTDLCQDEDYCMSCNNFGSTKTVQFRVHIQCKTLTAKPLAIITKPATGFITNNWQAFPISISNAQPTYQFKRYTSYVNGDTDCPAVQEYDVLDTDGSTRSTTFGDDAYQGTTSSLPTGPDSANVIVKLLNNYQVEADYTFRVKILSYPDATSNHLVGQENFKENPANASVVTDYDGNVIGSGFKWLNLVLHVYCDSSSTTLSQNTLPTHGTTIYRPVNNGLYTIYDSASYVTRFTMPTYTTQTAACYVEEVEISSTYVDDTTFSQHSQMIGFTSIDTAPNIRTFYADPTDKGYHRDYVFYARMTALGQYKKVFPQQFTMYVGCTGTMSLSDSASFLAGPFTKNVGDSKSNVYTFYDPIYDTNRPWCTSVLNIPIDQYISTNGGASWSLTNDAVTVAASCNGYSPCNSFDLARNDYEYMVKFKIRSYISQAPQSQPTTYGVPHTSPEVQFTIACGSSSTAINTKLTKADSRTHFRWMGTTNTDVYNFFEDDFWCDYPVCCTAPYALTYTMSSSSTAKVTHSIINANPTNIDTTLTPSNYSVSVPTGTHANNTALKSTDFYIYVDNGSTLGNYVLSAKITIQEQFNCYYDNFQINSGVPFLKLNFTVWNETSYTDDFSTRFTHAGPASLCPITKYEFKMVQDNDTTRFWSLAEINRNYKLDESSGRFDIRIFNQVYYFNKIYVRIFNKYIWSDVTVTGHVAEVQFYPVEKVLPNFTPTFEGDVTDYQVVDEGFPGVKLPTLQDWNTNDTVSVGLSLNNKKASWITFNNETNQIEVDIEKVQEECPECFGLNTLEVTLTDGLAEKSYSIQLEIKRPVKVAKQAEILEDDIYDNESNLTAKITRMNQFGEMTVTFSHEMNTEFVNISKINQTHLDIYIKPENNRHISRGFNLTALNLTWNVTSYNNSDLEIQVNFNEPPKISTLLIQDKIVFHIKKEGIPLFISKAVFEDETRLRNLAAAGIVPPMLIDKDYRTLDKRVRKQMWNSNTSRQAVNIFGNINNFLLYATAFIVAISFTFAGAATIQFQLLRALQLCLHLPLMSVVFPANALSCIAEIMQCIQYDIFEGINEKFFTFSEKNKEKYLDSIEHQVQDLGYESHFSLLNMGSLGFFMTVYFYKICIFLSLYALTSGCKGKLGKHTEKYEKMKKASMNSLFWGEFIIMLLEAYFEFLISAKYQLGNQANPFGEEILESGDRYSVILGWLNVISALIIMPGIFIFILKQHIVTINDAEFGKSYGAAYEGMYTKNKWQVAFFLLYCIRRIIYVFISIVLGGDSVYSQIMILHYMNIGTGIYNAKTKILKGKYAHRLENFNELMVTVITLHCLTFTEWVPDDNVKYVNGWSMDIFIIILIIANQIIVWIGMYRVLRLLCIKYWRIFRRWWFKVYPRYIQPHIQPCLDYTYRKWMWLWEKVKVYVLPIYEKIYALLMPIFCPIFKEEEEIPKPKKKKMIKKLVKVDKKEMNAEEWINAPDKWDVACNCCKDGVDQMHKEEMIEVEVTESEQDEFEIEIGADSWEFIKYGAKDFQAYRHERGFSFGAIDQNSNMQSVEQGTDWEAIMRKYDRTQDYYNNFDREDFMKHNPGVNFDEFLAKEEQFRRSQSQFKGTSTQIKKTECQICGITKKLEEYEVPNNLNQVQVDISQEDDDEHDDQDQWANIIAQKGSRSLNDPNEEVKQKGPLAFMNMHRKQQVAQGEEEGPKIEKTKLAAASPAPEEAIPKNKNSKEGKKNKVKIEKEIKVEKEELNKKKGLIPYIKNMFSPSEKQQPVQKKLEVKEVDVKESGEQQPPEENFNDYNYSEWIKKPKKKDKFSSLNKVPQVVSFNVNHDKPTIAKESKYVPSDPPAQLKRHSPKLSSSDIVHVPAKNINASLTDFIEQDQDTNRVGTIDSVRQIPLPPTITHIGSKSSMLIQDAENKNDSFIKIEDNKQEVDWDKVWPKHLVSGEKKMNRSELVQPSPNFGNAISNMLKQKVKKDVISSLYTNETKLLQQQQEKANLGLETEQIQQQQTLDVRLKQRKLKKEQGLHRGNTTEWTSAIKPIEVPDTGSILNKNPPKDHGLNLKKYEVKLRKPEAELVKINFKDIPQVQTAPKSSLEEIYARNAVEKQRKIDQESLKWTAPKGETLKPVDFKKSEVESKIDLISLPKISKNVNTQDMQIKYRDIKLDKPVSTFSMDKDKNVVRNNVQISKIAEFAPKRQSRYTTEQIAPTEKEQKEANYQADLEEKNQLSLDGVRKHLQQDYKFSFESEKGSNQPPKRERSYGLPDQKIPTFESNKNSQKPQLAQFNPFEKMSSLQPIKFDLENNHDRLGSKGSIADVTLGTASLSHGISIEEQQQIQFQDESQPIIRFESGKDTQQLQAPRFGVDFVSTPAMAVYETPSNETAQVFADPQRPRKGKKKKKKGMRKVPVDTEFGLMNYRPEISVMADINELAKVGREATEKDAQ